MPTNTTPWEHDCEQQERRIVEERWDAEDGDSGAVNVLWACSVCGTYYVSRHKVKEDV